MMATNSPASISSVMSSSTSVRWPDGPNPLETFLTSSKAMKLSSFESALHQAHQAIEHEAHDPDRENAQDDVRIAQRVVLLPQEATHARFSREHFRRDNDQPRDTEREPESREHVWQ